ncbi:MAG TPA: YqhA family protein [Cyclobacteriaceae bacterium]
MSGIKRFEKGFEQFTFWSRWVQSPMYVGLIFGAIMYLYKFLEELLYIALETYHMTEEKMMLAVLTLVDMSMVMNLVIITAIGGYTIFTSKIYFNDHEDKPLWLADIDAGQLKIKLASSLASVSGVHLLKTFLDFREAVIKSSVEGVVIEIIIHMVFIFSALLLAYTERITHSYPTGKH